MEGTFDTSKRGAWGDSADSRKRARHTGNAAATAGSTAKQLKRQYYIDEIVRLEKESDRLEAQADEDAEDGVVGSESEIADILKVLLQVSDANAADGAALAAEPSPTEQGGVEPDGEDTDTDTDADVTKHLHMLANVTGISFSEVKHAPLPAKKGKGGADNAIRRYNLEGAVFGLGFGLEFDVIEAAMAVDRMEVTIPENAMPELAEFIAGVKEARSPHLFFQVLVQYAERNAERRKAFGLVMASFPDLICVPQGVESGWFLSIATQASISFDAMWRIQVSTAGKVTASIDMTVTGDGNGTPEAKQVAQNISKRFGGMVRCLGACEALRLIAELVSSRSGD